MFLKDFYQEQPVAVNDIGAISYFANSRVVDLFGLASMEVANAYRERRFDRDTIDQITQKEGVRVAIVYDDWFQTREIGGFPEQWVRVG